VQAFIKDVQSMVSVMEGFGNPFGEESLDLIVLDTKGIAPPASGDAFRRALQVGQKLAVLLLRPRTACGNSKTPGKFNPSD
jgi:hypothetical protein